MFDMLMRTPTRFSQQRRVYGGAAKFTRPCRALQDDMPLKKDRARYADEHTTLIYANDARSSMQARGGCSLRRAQHATCL